MEILVSAAVVIWVLQKDIKMTCQTTWGMRLCGFPEKEREISCFYDIRAKKGVKDSNRNCPKKHWKSQHVLETRTHPCGSDEKHDGNLLLNEFPSIILKIKSCLLSESNDHPSNEPLKLVNTKQAYSERTESNQENSVTPKVIRIFTFGILQYLLFKSQDFVYM